MTNYQITFGYKAVIITNVKADSEKEAEEKALDILIKNRDKMVSGKLELQDDSYAVHGILNMDETWNML